MLPLCSPGESAVFRPETPQCRVASGPRGRRFESSRPDRPTRAQWPLWAVKADEGLFCWASRRSAPPADSPFERTRGATENPRWSAMEGGRRRSSAVPHFAENRPAFNDRDPRLPDPRTRLLCTSANPGYRPADSCKETSATPAASVSGGISPSSVAMSGGRSWVTTCQTMSSSTPR